MAHEPVSVAGLQRDKFVICEKPLTGYFGDGSKDFHWDRADKQVALDAALASVERMLAAERKSKGRLLYAENWVYAPASRRNGKSWRRPAGRFSGCTARRPTAARTRSTMPMRRAAAAAC